MSDPKPKIMTLPEIAADLLAQGDKYPHDAPNAFWFSTGGITAPTADDWAHRASRAILAEIRHRTGKFGVTKSAESERRELVTLIAEIIRLAKQEDPANV